MLMQSKRKAFWCMKMTTQVCQFIFQLFQNKKRFLLCFSTHLAIITLGFLYIISERVDKMSESDRELEEKAALPIINNDQKQQEANNISNNSKVDELLCESMLKSKNKFLHTISKCDLGLPFSC